MNNPLLGLVLGGVLGTLDGLTALVSTPEVKARIMTIVIGSTGKGLLAGCSSASLHGRSTSSPPW